MNKKTINIVNSIIASFWVLLILGCGGRSGNNAAMSDEKQNAKYQDSNGAMQDGMIEVVDLAGRTVTIPTGNVKVIVSSSLMIYAIAPLFGKNGNPFAPIVGWNDSINYDPDTYEMYVKKFPEIANIPSIGNIHKGDLSIEKVISLNADIVLVNLYHFEAIQEIKLIEKLEKVGVKMLFLDFGKYPTRYVIPSMVLLGQIFQKTTEVNKFINYSFAQMEKIYSVIDKIKEEEKPLVLLESAPMGGWSKVGQYMLFGSGWIGRLVELAGGREYGSRIFGDKYGATISTEQLFTIDPDVIIGTGGNWRKLKSDTNAISLGYKATKEDIQNGLKAMSSRTGWQTLKAVKSKKIHAIYHAFSYYPAYFIPVQQIAKWLYPDKFTDLNPEETFKEFHDKFLPIDYSGMFWASLE